MAKRVDVLRDAIEKVEVERDAAAEEVSSTKTQLQALQAQVRAYLLSTFVSLLCHSIHICWYVLCLFVSCHDAVSSIMSVGLFLCMFRFTVVPFHPYLSRLIFFICFVSWCRLVHVG